MCHKTRAFGNSNCPQICINYVFQSLEAILYSGHIILLSLPSPAKICGICSAKSAFTADFMTDHAFSIGFSIGLYGLNLSKRLFANSFSWKTSSMDEWQGVNHQDYRLQVNDSYSLHVEDNPSQSR